MAPQNKRANTTKASAPAKKAKVQASEEPEEKFALLLAPIFEAINASEKSAACCDTLRAALPHCLAEAPADRHEFQTRMLDLTASLLQGLAEEARTELDETRVQTEKLQSDATVAVSNKEVAQKLAENRKEQCDAKSEEVDKLEQAVKDAQKQVKEEMEKKKTFLENKATLATDQEAFQNMIDDTWEPLKTGTFSPQQWAKRNKACTNLIEKLRPLSVEGSLLDALDAALKIKVEQRSEFAQQTVAYAETAMQKHKAHLASRIAGAGDEEAAHDAAIAAAEAKLAAAKEHHEKDSKEYDELQNAWVDLENSAVDAKKLANNLENDAKAAAEEVDSCKSHLDGAIALVSSFATMREGSSAAATEEKPEEMAVESAEAVVEPVAVEAA